MKRSLMFTFAFFISICAFAQTIRRVSNIPNSAVGANTYSTVSDAIAAASNGDIIYIEPSATPYNGSFTVNKTLHFIGNGNFLSDNANTPFSKSESKIQGDVYFYAGSDNSTFTGLWMNNCSINFDNTTGIQIKKNRVDYGITLGTNTSGILIAENVLGYVIGYNTQGSGDGTTVSNNIITAGNSYPCVQGIRNSVIKNNTMVQNYPYNNANVLATNEGTAIINNILDRRVYSTTEDITANNIGSVATHNLQILADGSTVTPPPAGSFSVVTASPESVFVAPNPGSATPFTDGNFKLKAGSPALLIGSDGKDAGAFGGFSPYTLSGLPNIPIITSAFSTGAGTNTTPLSVKISVRSN